MTQRTSDADAALAQGAIESINALSEAALLAELRHCCASERWVATVAAARPFATVDDVLRAGEAAFDTLADADWREAWAASAARDLQSADEGTRNATLVALRLYQERFGYPFVVGTENIGGDELLMRVRIRLGLEPGAQLRATRYEQLRLTRARLHQMIERLGT